MLCMWFLYVTDFDLYFACFFSTVCNQPQTPTGVSETIPRAGGIFKRDDDHEQATQRPMEMQRPMPVEYLSVTSIGTPMSIMCAAVGEFGFNKQVVMVKVVGK